MLNLDLMTRFGPPPSCLQATAQCPGKATDLFRLIVWKAAYMGFRQKTDLSSKASAAKAVGTATPSVSERKTPPRATARDTRTTGRSTRAAIPSWQQMHVTSPPIKDPFFIFVDRLSEPTDGLCDGYEHSTNFCALWRTLYDTRVGLAARSMRPLDNGRLAVACANEEDEAPRFGDIVDCVDAIFKSDATITAVKITAKCEN